jgi:hypothetical protein
MSINYVQAESITHSVPVINSDHAAIHSGYGMCAHLYHASLAGGAVKSYRYNSPETLFAHIKGIQVAQIGSTIQVELIKNAVITVPGEDVVDAIKNLNDNNARTAQSRLYDSNVAFTGGEIWCSIIVHGSSTNQSSSSGSFIQSDNLEYVTKNNNTDYIIRIKNLEPSSVSKHININMFFYEEPYGESKY